MRLVALERQAAVADLEHVGVVPMPRRRVLPQLDVVLVDELDPSPIGIDVGRGAPKIARARAPLVGLIEPPFAYREGDRFERLSGLFGHLLRRRLERRAHLAILQHSAVRARRYRVEHLDDVDPLAQRDYQLETRGDVPKFLRRDLRHIVLFAVDGDHQRLFVKTLFTHTDGQNVLAVLFGVDVVELERAAAGVKPADVAAALHLFVGHELGKPADLAVRAGIELAIALPPLDHLDAVDERRVFGDGHVVAKVVFEILKPPPRERQRVLVLVAVARRKIFAGQCAVGRVDARFEPERVDLGDKRLHAVSELGQIVLHLAVFVPERRVPIVVDVDAVVSRVKQTFLLHRDRGLVDQILVDGVLEGVPARPPHRRSGRVAALVFDVGIEIADARRAREQLFEIADRAHAVAFHSCPPGVVYISILQYIRPNVNISRQKNRAPKDAVSVK